MVNGTWRQLRRFVLACLLASAAMATPAQAAEPSMRVAVVRRIVVPKQKVSYTREDGTVVRSVDRAEEAARRLETTLSSLDVDATTRVDLATCRDAPCLRRLREQAGMTHLLNLEALYDADTRSYSVSLSLFETASGVQVSKKSASCPHKACTASDMTSAIVDVTTAAVTEARQVAKVASAEPPTASAGLAAPPGPPAPEAVTIGPKRPEPPRDSPAVRRGRGWGWWLIGGGAALTTAGAIALAQHGELADCTGPKNDDNCRTTVNAKVPALGLLVAGGSALLLGGLDLFGLLGSGSPSQDVGLLVGPGHITVAGRF